MLTAIVIIVVVYLFIRLETKDKTNLLPQKVIIVYQASNNSYPSQTLENLSQHGPILDPVTNQPMPVSNVYTTH